MNLSIPMGRLLAMAALVLAVASCNTNNSNSELDLIPVNSVTVQEYTVSLFAEKEPETGFNMLYWQIEKNGDRIEPQQFSITPMMDMGEMMHSTPYTEPQTAEEDDRYLKNMVVFIMPGGEMGSWSVQFEILTQDDELITGELPVNVNSSWKLTSVRNESDKIYFITWYSPQNPISGNNELAFMVHTRESMMSFPPVSDAELLVYPYMDMGGGSGHSTDFTNPVATGNGMYEGDINYSMSGVWTTSVELTVNGETMPEVVFEYSVQAK